MLDLEMIKCKIKQTQVIIHKKQITETIRTVNIKNQKSRKGIKIKIKKQKKIIQGSMKYLRDEKLHKREG